MKSRPWIWLVLLFMASVVAWAIFIVVAVKHQPRPVPGLEAPRVRR